MASKSKENTGEEEQRLERSCRSKIGIIRRLMSKQKTAEERVLCANWLSFFSSCAKHDYRTRDCLLDLMMRQLREGKLSQPFTSHVNCRTDLTLLLDGEGRQRLRRSSAPKVVASKPSKHSRSQSLSPFIWRERVKHLSALEEQYRRDEHKQWLQEFSVSALQPKAGTAIQEIGVQVELPVPAPRAEDDVFERARKRQEIKERRDRERQRDLALSLRSVAQRRQLDLQQRAEARRLQERRLHEQQLKVKEQRDHERNLITKRREAQTPRIASQRNRGPRTLSQRQKPVESNVKWVNVKPARAGKKSEKAPEARKPVCPTCNSVTSCARCEVLEQQNVLRAENVKKKLIAYEELKQFHSKKALEERARLNKERLQRGKALQEAEQGRASGGEIIRGKVSEDRDRIRRQEELKESQVKSEQRQKKDLQRKTQKQVEKERDKRRKQKELEKEFEALEELEQKQKKDIQGKSQRQREKEIIQEGMKERVERIVLDEKEEQEDSEEKDEEEEEDLKKFQKHREKKSINKTKQEELKEKVKARKELERRQKKDPQRKSQKQLEREIEMEEKDEEDEDEEEETREERIQKDLQRKSQKQLEKERYQKRKQKELEEKVKAREKLEQRPKKDPQKEYQRQLERERETEEQIMDDIRFDYFNRRERELLQKWVDLQKKYEVPAGQLSPTTESKLRKKEIKAKKKFLKEATEHTKQISNEIIKITKSPDNLLPVEFEEKLDPKTKNQTKRREPPGDRKSRPSKSGLTLRQAHEKFMAKAGEISRGRKPQHDSYARVQGRLRKVQERKDLLSRQISYRCQEIEMQKHLARQKMISAQSEELFAQCWQKTQQNWLQADIIRGKCLKELRDIQATLQMISIEEEGLAAAALERGKGLGNMIRVESQRLQAGSGCKYSSLSDPQSKDEGSPQWNTYRFFTEVNDIVPPLKVIYKKEQWTASRSARGEEEPRRYPDHNLVFFCTRTGRKRYPSICKRGASRRQETPHHRRFFTQILGQKKPTECSPRKLTAHNRILERKLSVAKASAVNRHVQKSLLLGAGGLIDGLLYEKAQAQPSTKPPRYIFQAIIDPLLQGVEDVPRNVLEDIKHTDNQLEAHLESLIEGQGANEQLEEGRTHELPLVPEVLHDFYDLEPQLNEILQRIDQQYRQWRDKQPDFY